MKYSFNYIVEIQYLGFRFHGWQKQNNVKTIHEMIDKTLHFVFKNERFKSLGVGRTDAMVSANNYFFQLFLDNDVDKKWFIHFFNENLPPDINALSIRKTPKGFDLINCSKTKEYHYYFSFGEKNHPFAAPFMVNILEDLDVELMKKGANLFQGEHYFHKYCTKPSANTIFKRIIDSCEIVMNRFADFMGGDNLIAHNASFDQRFLEAEFARINRKYSGDFSCSLLLSRRIFQDAHSHKLGELVRYRNIESSGGFHRALFDSEMTAKVWMEMLEDIGERYGIFDVPFELIKKITKTPKKSIDKLLSAYVADN